MACCDSADPLWKKIDNRVRECESSHYDPNHCKWIDPKQGYALSPENPPSSAPPNLLVPTICILGIECPEVWNGSTPNYWNLAWTKLALPFLSTKKEKVGMAINAKWTGEHHRTRDFNQLHIHVKCIDSTVKGTLDKSDNNIPKWSSHTIMELPSKGVNKNFRVSKLENDADLASTNLFKGVYYMIHEQQKDMEYQTLIVAKRQKGGFYILNSDTVSNDLNKNGISDGERLLVDC